MKGPVRVAAVLVALVIGFAVVSPGIFPLSDPYRMHPESRLEAPSLGHPFGTDEFGRDVFSRVIHGARFSTGLALLVVVLSAVIGCGAGLIAGYAGGTLDNALMRLVDVFLAVPQLILAIAIASALGQNVFNAVVGLAGVWWAQYARVMRSEVLTMNDREFVLAARALGASPARTMLRHVMPNCLTPIFVKTTLDFGLAILYISALSFIGLGVKPPTPEWGAMVTSGRRYLIGYWWIATWPGLAIFFSSLCFNILGNRVRRRMLVVRAA